MGEACSAWQQHPHLHQPAQCPPPSVPATINPRTTCWPPGVSSGLQICFLTLALASASSPNKSDASVPAGLGCAHAPGGTGGRGVVHHAAHRDGIRIAARRPCVSISEYKPV